MPVAFWQIGDEEPLRFRCHVGHSFTAGPFLAEQTNYVEDALWSAVRALEEKVTLTRQVAKRMSDSGLDSAGRKYQEHADNLDKEVSIVRDLILYDFATKRNIDEHEQKRRIEPPARDCAAQLIQVPQRHRVKTG